MRGDHGSGLVLGDPPQRRPHGRAGDHAVGGQHRLQPAAEVAQRRREQQLEVRVERRLQRGRLVRVAPLPERRVDGRVSRGRGQHRAVGARAQRVEDERVLAGQQRDLVRLAGKRPSRSRESLTAPRRLLDRLDARHAGQPEQHVGLERHPQAGRRLVGDQRHVRRPGDRLVVGHHRLGRQRRAEERRRGEHLERGRAELAGRARLVRDLRGVAGQQPGGHRDAIPDPLDGEPQHLLALAPCEQPALPGVGIDDDAGQPASGKRLEVRLQRVPVDRLVVVQRQRHPRDGARPVDHRSHVKDASSAAAIRSQSTSMPRPGAVGASTWPSAVIAYGLRDAVLVRLGRHRELEHAGAGDAQPEVQVGGLDQRVAPALQLRPEARRPRPARPACGRA